MQVVKTLDVNGVSLDQYWPDDEEDFCIQITAKIGPSDSDSGDYYRLVVCTQKWLSIAIKGSGSFWGARHLLVARFDDELIRSVINDLVANVSGLNRTKNDFVQALSPFMEWEFEGY